MQDCLSIAKIQDPEEKATIASEVLLDLPDWFGLPDSTKAFIEESKGLPLWAATIGQEVVGFITLSESSPETGEIHCMGVKKAYHRRGIGTKLYLALEAYAREKYKYLHVKTVEEGRYPEYDQTVAFYKSLGFSKLGVFPTLWNEQNPCLIMVKAL
ncbi:MAG TPA: GNAT family N-acetyltransferase [Firmicutes bacterium]|nr:GNAT family N-acetyltransferase [Candidatus Fermentithermobacillaceae bacterium]